MTAPGVLAVMSRETWADQFDDARRSRLARAARTLGPTWIPRLDDPAARSVLADVEVLISSWGAGRLSAERLAMMPRLRAVLHCAGSVRPIVSEALWERGILLSSAADANADPVAELTYAAIIMAGKKAPFLAADARAHRSGPADMFRFGPIGNSELTVGIVGMSRIGRRVLDHLVARLEGVTCLVTDPLADAREVEAAGGRLVGLDEMLASVDVLTIHAPELPQTRGMIGAAELGALRDYATVINTARGALVDTAALENECRKGRLNAILDVTDPEPLPPESVLFDLPNVMLTPHIAGSLGAERLRMSDSALDELDRLVAGKPLRHQVHREELAYVA